MELVNKAGGLAKTFTIKFKVFKDIDGKMFDICTTKQDKLTKLDKVTNIVCINYYETMASCKTQTIDSLLVKIRSIYSNNCRI